jgi:aminopeptidase N
LALTFNAQVPAQTSQGYGIFNRALGVVALAGWYPVLAVYDGGWLTPPVPLTGDAMMAETSLYEVDLTVPEGYELVSTGTTLERHRSEEGVTWHVVSGPVREFAVAISDRFQVLETQVGEVTLRLYTLPAGETVVTDYGGLAVVTGAFETFVDRFGPYPFLELDVVEAGVPLDGYEFSGMVYVDYGVRTQESLDDYEYVVAHEVAHQWWYGIVGNLTVDESWLDEGLATYAAVLYMEDTYGPAAGESLLGHWRRMEGGRRPQDPPLNSPTLEFSSWGPYHKTVYTQAAFFLAQLREELGEEAFFEFLKRYQRTYRYRIATTWDFLRLAEGVAGSDKSLLFESWFDTEAARVTGARDGVHSRPAAEPHELSPASPSPQPGAGPQEF